MFCDVQELYEIHISVSITEVLLECSPAPCACIISALALQFLSGHVGAAESVRLENPKILTL